MKNIITILLLQFVALSLFAQDKSLTSYIKSQVVNDDGVVQHITFKDNEKPNFKDGINVLKQFLEVSEGITFVKLESVVDKIGMTHDKYQQYYNEIPVEFGIYKVHSKNQKLSSINGEFYPINEIDTTPLILASEAISKAKQHVNAEEYIEESDTFYSEHMGYNGPEPTLVILPKIEQINTTNRLAYRLDIYAETPLYRADVYVDAQTGDIIFENSQIQHIDDLPNIGATGATLYNGQQAFTAELSGGSYRLRQSTSGNGIQTFDAGNGLYSNAVDVTSSTTNFASNQDAVQAHWGAEQTYNYYFQRHGRNSFDDNGAIIKSYVNYGPSSLVGPFWNGSVVTYYGGSTSSVNEVIALDIVGHEITHGVIKHSAGLIYSYQSGALNESFADIFGEMVENHTQQGTNDWLGGADVYVNQGGFSRSFSNPKLKNDPDTYLGQYWHTSYSDNFGVHKNSGVQNKWFYLLSEGGTGTNDNNYSYAVSGIGKIAAAEIAYRNLTVYLTPTSNFFDARAGAIQSAMDLNNNDANSPEVIATIAAWDAVGVVVTSSSDIIPPTAPLNLVSSNFTQYNIDLSWDTSTDNIGVLGYNIYKNGAKIGTSSTPNYSNGNLPMPVNNLYDFTVAAFDAAGNVSGLSNVVTLWIDTIKPSIPQNLMSANTTQTTTDLSWDASTDNFTVAGYNIYQNNTLLATVTNTSYNVTGLTPNTPYPFRITAIDDSGNESNMSNQEIVTTQAPIAPCVDGNVTLTIITDPFYPDETSWDIKDENDVIIASSCNYTVAGATHSYNFTLKNGYYTLNMHDDFGDGFIAPGGYTLESNVVIAPSGITLYPSPYTVSHPFCVDSNLSVYTYNNGWLPSNPNGIATASDDIVIVSGNATINTNTTCNSLTVNAGAALTIDSASTLSVSNGLTLESCSTTYSSLILDGFITGTIKYKRHVNINGSSVGLFDAGITGSNDLISAPLTGQSFNTFATANSNIFSNTNGTLFLFGPFDKITGDYLTYSDTETNTLDAGVGYRAASDNNDTFTFTGTANNGIVTHNITNSGPTGAQWNLVGNPYPSYLNVQAFLNHQVSTGVTNVNLMNSGTTAIYGYDGNAAGGWVIYNLANTTASTVIAPGQGFFVSADPTLAPLYDLEFTPAMRSTGTDDDFIMGRSANTTNALSKIILTNATKNANTSIYFIEGTTRGLDAGYDASSYQESAGEFSIFTNLVEDNEGLDIAIQSLPYNDFNAIVIPLGVNAVAESSLTIGLDDNSSLPSNINVYLEDTQDNTLTLLNTTNYTFTLTDDLVGTGRFFLRYTSETLSLNTDNELNELLIYTNENHQNIIIKGKLNAETKAELYDIQGRLVLNKKLYTSKQTNTIDVASISSGIYIINLEFNKGVISKKIIINNK